VAYEVQCERADGSLFDARVYGRLVTQRGRPADLITFSDVTELTQATEKLKRSYLTSIKVFSNLIELRGGQLVGHGRRVADMARALAKAMDCTVAECQDIFVAGLLHDVGMIGLPDVSFEKTVPKLNVQELATYKEHCVVGEHSLMALEDMQPVATLIRSHHERFNGGGFPDGLAGADIPLGARILAVADAHDDLLHGHMGVTRLTVADTHTLLRHSKGTQFDPAVVDALIRLAQDSSKAPAAALPLILKTADLRQGMVLAADLVSPGGVMMLSKDHVLTAELIQRIRRFEQREGTVIELRIQNPARR
jgi:response regulator RpfG family c-di-GMP phosphodiesterase